MGRSDTRWERADAILDEALDLPTEARRDLIADRCGRDGELRELVERLLVRCEEEETGLMPGGAFLGAIGESLDRELEDSAGSLEGRQIGRYKVLRELGRGGMAVVYLAERAEGDFHHVVALKLLQPGIDSGHVAERFALERQILALARHPNIARLLDAGVTEDGRPFIAMEYVEGEPIDAWCDQRRLPIRARLELFLEVARAVDYAHRNLVVHRDIKPSNILVTADGDVKLLDFGIAKLLDDEHGQVTRTHQRAMTPAYASPEQVEGGVITTATDVYQLGMLLYLLLTGCWPYPRGTGTNAAMLLAICNEQPIRPSAMLARRRDDTATPNGTPAAVDDIALVRGSQPTRIRRELAGDLDTIVLTALRKEPGRRYPSVAQLVSDIERFLDGRTISARPDTVAYRLKTFVRRHSAATATAAASLVMVIGLVAFYTIQLGLERNHARLEARKAGEVADFLTGLFEVSAPTRSKGEAVTARELLDRGAERIDDELADQPELQAAMMTIIGDVYRELAMYDEAEELLERAVEIRREHPGDDQLDLAASLFALGRVHQQQRNIEEGRKWLSEALVLRESALGPEHPDVARVLDGLGEIERYDGNLAEAQALHEEAVAIFEATIGTDNVDYGLAMNRLAVVVQDQREHEASLPLFERSIEVLSAELGADHPYTASAKLNFAYSLRYAGQVDRADALYREVLPVIETAFGAEHPNVAVVVNAHALLLRNAGRFDEAETLHRRALAIWSASLGPNSTQASWALNNLGLVERERGNHETARDYFRRSVEVAEAVYGPDHAEVATQLNNLAKELHALGRSDEAVGLMERALAIRERVFGMDHSYVGSIAGEMGEVLCDAGRHQRAEPLFRRAAELGRTDPDHRDHEVTYYRIRQARCLLNLGRREEAQQVLITERAACNDDGQALVDAALAEISPDREPGP